MTRACTPENRRQRLRFHQQTVLAVRDGRLYGAPRTSWREIGSGPRRPEQKRRLTEAARAEDTPEYRVGFPVLYTFCNSSVVTPAARSKMAP